VIITLNSNHQSAWNIRNVSERLRELYRSMEKLSSGLAINRASDDPAGLMISETLRSRTASLSQEIKNVSGTISKYQTVSSTVSELRSRLTELRSLAVGAATEGGNSEEAQQAYTAQARDLVSSFNATANGAEYNGARMLDGSESSLAKVTPLSGIDLSTPEAAAESIQRIDIAAHELDNIQIDLGSTQKNDLESRLISLRVTRENLTAAESQVRDTDYAQEYASLVSSMIRTRVSLAILAHTFRIGMGIVDLLGRA
jgi:flagellin